MLKFNPDRFKLKYKPSAPAHNLVALLSPTGMAIISTIPFFLSMLMPQSIYEYYTSERYIMWSNVWMPVFFLSCTVCFILGSKITQKIIMNRNVPMLQIDMANQPLLFIVIIIVLFLLMVLNTISFLIMLKNTPGLINLIFSGAGDTAKETLNTDGALTEAQPLLVFYNGYALFRYLQFKPKLPFFMRIIAGMMVFASIFLTILIAIAKVARFEIIPILLVLLLSLGFHRALKGPISLATLALTSGLIISSILAIFIAFSLFRGSQGFNDLATSVMGYGPASFNHLAAEVNDELRLRFAGTGIYSASFFAQLPLIESIFHIREQVGMPAIRDAFLNEFSDTGIAGLNESFIWVTAFGYLYADLGNFVFLAVGFMGALAELAWRGFCRGGAFGVIFYPFVAASAILFFSSNYFARPELITVLGLSIMMGLIEAVCSNGKRQPFKLRAFRSHSA